MKFVGEWAVGLWALIYSKSYPQFVISTTEVALVLALNLVRRWA